MGNAVQAPNEQEKLDQQPGSQYCSHWVIMYHTLIYKMIKIIESSIFILYLFDEAQKWAKKDIPGHGLQNATSPNHVIEAGTKGSQENADGDYGRPDTNGTHVVTIV